MSKCSFDAALPLLGCGIDAESPSRFSRFAGGEADPWPSVFTRREVDHSRSMPDAAMALCAAFCCKEAWVKACGGAVDPLQCEVFWDPGSCWQQLDTPGPAPHVRARARVWFEPTGECVAVVVLHPGEAEPCP